MKVIKCSNKNKEVEFPTPELVANNVITEGVYKFSDSYSRSYLIVFKYNGIGVKLFYNPDENRLEAWSEANAKVVKVNKKVCFELID